LAGRIVDSDRPVSVVIKRRYADDSGPGSPDVATATVRADELGQTVALGHGRNEINVTVRDATGAERTSDVVVTATDDTAPTADLTASAIDNATVQLTGTVRDDFAPAEIRVQQPYGGLKVVRLRRGSLDLDRDRRALNLTAEMPPKGVDGVVTVVLVDRAGNERTVRVPVRPEVTPTATATPMPTPTATPTPPPAATPAANTSTPAPSPTATATPTPAPSPAEGNSGGLSWAHIAALVVALPIGFVVLKEVVA
jgi:septal ring-binding cell division protein DamX